MSAYIPLPDPIVREHGVYAACVYGRVWRYCQIGGVCTAAILTIADDLAISVATVKRHLASLVESGYLSKAGGGKSGRPSTYRLTGKWVMGAEGGSSERTTQVAQKEPPPSEEVDQNDPPTQLTENHGVAQKELGGSSERTTRSSERATRDIPSSPSSPFMDLSEEEEASRASAPVHTRPAPKPGPLPRQTPPSPSPVIDPDDEMAAAMLAGCCLDPELTRTAVLISVADYAKRLKARRFTPDEVREAAATWHEFLPHLDPEDVEPPHPQQLVEWVGRRRAAKAQRRAAGSHPGSKAAAVADWRVPFIER